MKTFLMVCAVISLSISAAYAQSYSHMAPPHQHNGSSVSGDAGATRDQQTSGSYN